MERDEEGKRARHLWLVSFCQVGRWEHLPSTQRTQHCLSERSEYYWPTVDQKGTQSHKKGQGHWVT